MPKSKAPQLPHSASADKILVREILKYLKKDFDSFKTLTTENKDTLLLTQQHLKDTTDELANFGKSMEVMGKSMTDLAKQISENYVSQKTFEEYKNDAEKQFAPKSEYDLTKAKVEQMWSAAKLITGAVGLAIVGALLSLIFINH